MNMLQKHWKLLAPAAVAAGLILFFLLRDGADGAAPDAAFETALVDRGSISQSVATSGSVRPLVTVEVGSQLSGQIEELFADFNSEVTEGELIARLDPQTYESRVVAARADKAVAVATLSARQADLRRAQALADQAKSDYERYEGLGDEAGLAAVELDAYRAQMEAARADLDSAKAQLDNAKALVAQREAALDQAEVDLKRTEIRSPINGVVISRSVDVGQTVAASLSAPILFEIAQDLSRIQIEADVNEADIGSIAKGNPVNFTVDAYPGRTFSGEVDTVRLAPIEEANVVTYTVIIHADNPGRSLFPGMTATVEIITGKRDDTLRIPNAAARFEPANAEELMAEARQSAPARGPGGRNAERMAAMAEELGLSDDQQKELQSKMRELFANSAPPGPGGPTPEDRRKRMQSIFKSVLTDEQWTAYQEQQKDRPQIKTVWVQTGAGKLEPRRVFIGISDSSHTEIAGGDLQEGDAVITRQRLQS